MNMTTSIEKATPTTKVTPLVAVHCKSVPSSFLCMHEIQYFTIVLLVCSSCIPTCACVRACVRACITWVLYLTCALGLCKLFAAPCRVEHLATQQKRLSEQIQSLTEMFKSSLEQQQGLLRQLREGNQQSTI